MPLFKLTELATYKGRDDFKMDIEVTVPLLAVHLTINLLRNAVITDKGRADPHYAKHEVEALQDMIEALNDADRIVIGKE